MLRNGAGIQSNFFGLSWHHDLKFFNSYLSEVYIFHFEFSKTKELRIGFINMPRTKSSPLKCVSSTNGRSKTWVLMIEKNVLSIDDAGGDATPDIVKLRHPRTGVGAMFLFSGDNSIVQEVFSFSEKRSWFINNSVREDGKMHFSTPVDPCFLVLPYLKKSKEEGRVVPLEDLLVDSVFPETYRLLKSSALKNIHLLADRKGNEELNAWMYNEEKTLKWLCKKTERVAQILRDKQINVRGCATSKNFIKSAKDDSCNLDEESYLRYAHGLVSEYLTDDLSLKLLQSLGLPEEQSDKKAIKKRKLLQSVEQEDVKKQKVEPEVMDLSKPEKPKLLSAKEKARIKAAKDSKTITSFFKKK